MRLAQAGYCLIGFVLPVLLFFRLRGPASTFERSLGCFVGSVAICWLLLNVYRCFTLPMEIQYMHTLPQADPEDPIPPGMHDGVGGNVALLVFGWLPPAAALIVVYLARRIWSGLQNLRRATCPPQGS